MLLIDTDRFSEIIVVRCKDCKSYYCEHCLNDNGLIMPKPDDFCSYGERLKPMKLIAKYGRPEHSNTIPNEGRWLETR